MQELFKEITIREKQIKAIICNTEKMRVLHDWLLTELAYTSNAIEGNTLTRKETNRAITQNITTGSKPIKDYLEAKNHADAFKLIFKLAKNRFTNFCVLISIFGFAICSFPEISTTAVLNLDNFLTNFLILIFVLS